MPITRKSRISPKRTPNLAAEAAQPGHVTYGNVLDDLGFSDKKAASLKLKADLHKKIMKRAQGYSQQELQNIFHETQARVSHLVRGKIAGFTLDMLVFYAESLGIHAEIKTREVKAPAHMEYAVLQ